MTGFLTSKFSGYLSIFGVLACLLLVWYIYNEGSKACEAKIVKETVIKYEKRNELEKEIRTLPRTELVSRYCKWVRDSESECLQANLPVR